MMIELASSPTCWIKILSFQVLTNEAWQAYYEEEGRRYGPLEQVHTNQTELFMHLV
jgi:hypothetical protein